MKDVSLRRMTEGDLTAADSLRQIAGWDQRPADWRRLLWLEPEGCFLAERDGEVIGTVTTTTYGQTLAWIGMMLVHPDSRGKGIGTRLMQLALEYLQARGVKCVKLDATPAGRPLYEKLGFVPELTLTRCNRVATTRPALDERAQIIENPARKLADADWPDVEAIDAAAFGISRARLITNLASESRAALVWPTRSRVGGWGLLRSGAGADYLGPVVCSSAEGSLLLVAGLLEQAENRPVIWDVSDKNEAARSAAERFNFVALRPLTRMRLGPDLVVSDWSAQFAIADPTLG